MHLRRNYIRNSVNTKFRHSLNINKTDKQIKIKVNPPTNKFNCCSNKNKLLLFDVNNVSCVCVCVYTAICNVKSREF